MAQMVKKRKKIQNFLEQIRRQRPDRDIWIKIKVEKIYLLKKNLWTMGVIYDCVLT